MGAGVPRSPPKWGLALGLPGTCQPHPTLQGLGLGPPPPCRSLYILVL